jgi:predicted permease
MDHLTRDLRYALRGIRSSPGFTLVAVVTIALGIGVNATIFSLVNAVLLRPLPVERPSELVDIYGHSATSSSHDSNSYPNFVDYRDRSETLAGAVAYTNFFANLSVERSSELVVGEIVSEDYFDVLGVRPAMGRAFTPDEFRALGAGPVAVLSHRFWQNRFGGDPGVIGRTFRLNGTVFTVVGVAPRSFGGMMPAVTPQMWVPLTMLEAVEPLGSHRTNGPIVGDSWLEHRARHFLWIRGRMKPGVEVAQVRAEIEGIATRLAAEYPETNGRERVEVLATNDVAVNPDFDRTLAPVGLVLLGAVGLVLLVACANLANMMLARGVSRRRELAIRTAMGAARGRLVRQLLTESVILALVGGSAAMLLSGWLTALIGRMQPPLPINLGVDIAPDWRVMLFTFAVAALTGIVFGLLPALRASRPDLVPALKDTGAGEGRRGRRVELRDALVVTQVAVSVVLLVGGALMVRSVAAAARIDLGYDARRIAHLDMALEMNGYDDARGGAFLETASARLAAVPGVVAVGLTSRIPLSLNNNGFSLFIDDHQASADDRPYRMDGAYVDEGYFDVLGLEIVAGRPILATDRDGGLRVAVVTRTMAERYWPGEDAVGREFRRDWGGEPWTIVGVVEDYRVDTPGESPKPYLHLPQRTETTYGNILVRTATDAAPMVPGLERELRALDPDLVFLDTGTIWNLAEVRIFPVRAGAWLIGAFGVLALVLAAVGLYGVIGYSVSRRLREIGIRKALGARSGEVVALVLKRGMLLVAAGGLVGAVLAALGGQALSAALYVDVFDPLSYGGAVGVLAGVAALAHWVPARRATSVDPVRMLRSE